MHRSSHLRAGDADREQAAAELTRHYSEGRLRTDELSERLEIAYRARTLGELSAVTRDLPGSVGRRGRTARRSAALIAFLLLAVVGLAAAGLVEVVAQSPEQALLGLLVLTLVAVVLLAVLVPVLIAAAPFVAMAVAAVWAFRRWGTDRAMPEWGAGRAFRR